MAQNKNNTLIQKADSNTKMQVKKVYWVHCFICLCRLVQQRTLSHPQTIHEEGQLISSV